MQTCLLKGNKGFGSVWVLICSSKLLIRIVTTLLRWPHVPGILDCQKEPGLQTTRFLPSQMRTVKISSSKHFTDVNSLIVRYRSWAPGGGGGEEHKSKFKPNSISFLILTG